MDLTTVDRVLSLISSQAESGGRDASESVQAEVAKVVSSVSALAAQYMNRRTLAGSVTEYLDVGAGQRFFRLSGFPVTALTSVHFDPDQVWGSDTAVDATSYASPLFSERGVLQMRVDLAEDFAPSALRVVYVGGMAANTAAFVAAFPDLSEAVDLQCASVYHNRNALGLQSAVLPGGGSLSTLQGFWISAVRTVLDRYRRVA